MFYSGELEVTRWIFPQTEEVNSEDHGPCICGRCPDSITGNFLFASIWRSGMWAKKDKRKLLLRGSIADIVGIPPISIGTHLIKVFHPFQLPA